MIGSVFVYGCNFNSRFAGCVLSMVGFVYFCGVVYMQYAYNEILILAT